MASTSVFSKLPRIHFERGFLSSSDHATLLENSLMQRDDYRSSEVNSYDDGSLVAGRVDENTRFSQVRKLDPQFRKLLRHGVAEIAEEICAAIGVAFPEQRGFEIEAVHSGHGAHFKRHIDTARGDRSRHRVISAVYYYSRSPKSFSGGELKLFSLDRKNSIVIEPEDNSMVFFRSTFPHEVLKVEVPSRKFEDGRFSVNCWVNRL